MSEGSSRPPDALPRVLPKHELGQHFLADRNLLDVIGRLARLQPDDVALEVGAGVGVLTAYLAERVAHVHAVEIDESLEPHLRTIVAQHGNVALTFVDALSLEIAALEPPPTSFVANLPYSIATPLVVESLERAPTVERWCVMVQREVADRFFATPGTKAYGAVSVLVQLTAERTGFHPVSRTVFRPAPNVDSALVAFRRTPPPARYDDVKRVVTAAFAHRRKTLANSLALAGVGPRERTVDALAALGHAAGARAEQLAPGEFVALAEELR